MSKIPNVKCPTCAKRGPWFDDEYGPFCSQKCKLIDLGQWFDEDNKISTPLAPNHFSGYDELPPGPYLDHPEGE